MVSSNDPITELVQIPLAIPFTEFLGIFSKHLEPVLLAQPGLRSIMTGVIIPENEGEQSFAVSFTQWDSIEAHEAFGKSADAGPFFDRLKPLTTGPPTIEHYYLGLLESSARQSRYGHVLKFSVLSGQAQKSLYEEYDASRRKATALQGNCMEVDAQSALVLFDDSKVFQPQKSDEIVTSFTVRWHRAATGKISAAL
ncbi:hypothetical protein AK830_g3615 [Neonectria ditissima]|uniref:ABM domain-containing protein n=1 Tax=Neonectria ditissima TaxID=78410 RepID=A0A0P7B8D1_9HYPO|nr:hypothetical protein AK830_g3615 [Neonectria ditissima]